MNKSFRTTRRAEFHQTDAAGIVHFSQFFIWMEQVEHEFFRHLGWSVVAQLNGRTISWPRVASSCEFFRPVRFEDVVEVTFGVAELRRSSAKYRSVFTLGDQEVARGTMTAVCCQVGDDGRFSATEIPDSLRQQLQQYLPESESSL